MHCVVMCGGMASALGIRARAHSRDSLCAFVEALLYQMGRVSGYVVAGVIFGTLSAATVHAIDLVLPTLVLRVASGVLIALVGLRQLLSWNPLAWIERWGARFWRCIQPVAQQAAQQSGPGQALTLGFLWGWLPCGLVYSMLLLAAMSGSASMGGGVMLAFGLGTLPSMLTSSLLASRLQRVLSKRLPKAVGSVLLLAAGVWMIAGTLQMAGHHVAS